MKTINLRGLTPLFLVFSLFVAIGIGAAAATPSVSINPELTEDICPEQTFTVTVEVDSDTHNLRTLSLDLTYDDTVLQVNNIDESNDLFGTSYMTEPGSGDDGAGTIQYGMASTEGTYTPSDGTFITIEFEVKAGAADATYPLDLQDVVLLNQDNGVIPDVDVTDGNAEVDCGTPTPDPKVYITPELTEDICPEQTFTVTVEVDSDTHNLRTLSLDLTYDDTVLQVNNIDESNDLFGTSYMTEPGSGDDGAGTIQYGMASTEGTYTPSDGTFITIEFEVKAGAADATYPLDLQDVVLLNQDNGVIPDVDVTDGAVVVSSNDPPTVTVTAPVSDTVSGTIDVTATATDTDGTVTQVAFYLMPAGTLIGTDSTGGWSVQLDTTIAADGTGYRIKAVATDNEGATGDDTGGVFEIDNSCPCDFCLDLDAGWNFVSVPNTLNGSNDANTVFNLTLGETCLYYDCVDGWKSNSAVSVVPCQGYWVGKVASDQICLDFDPGTGATTPPEQDLCQGWNMIGHIQTSPMSVGEFASATTLGDNIAQIWQWDQTNGWEGYPFGGFADMTPGRGYWILVGEEDTMYGTP